MVAVYNERTGVELTARYFNQSGPTVPVTAHWRLDCQTTGQLLQDWTEVSVVVENGPTGLPVNVYSDIDISSTLNRILRNSNGRETKVVTVSAGKDTDREFNVEYPYVIKNIRSRT